MGLIAKMELLDKYKNIVHTLCKKKSAKILNERCFLFFVFGVDNSVLVLFFGPMSIILLD